MGLLTEPENQLSSTVLSMAWDLQNALTSIEPGSDEFHRFNQLVLTRLQIGWVGEVLHINAGVLALG